MNFVEMMTEKDTHTLNGAVTNSTSHNYNLDLFFLAGACRNVSDEEIGIALNNSYLFNREKTLKIIYWACDIRQGAGERRFFKVALNWLYKNHREDFYKYLNYDPEFSRWDVLFDFDDEKVLDYICENLKQKNPLLCKWLPRKVIAVDKRRSVQKDGNTEVKTVTSKKRVLHNALVSKIRKRLGWSPKRYRKTLVKASDTVEQKMCARKWSEIEYSKVPSVAMNKYNKAWYRNDKERFEKYLEDVKSGKEKINSSVIFPHDIIKSYMSGWNVKILPLNEAQIVQWENLPNWVSSNDFIPVCDTSGSMFTRGNGVPAQISLALGLYLSERNTGVFKDAFITFSDVPTFNYVHGDLHQRLGQLASAEWGNSTNLLSVFDLILQKATSVNLPANEMPKNILVISDMEFNECARLTNYESIKIRYLQAGYNVPNIVFWNVNGRPQNLPVTVNERGAALISGASPSIIKTVLSGEVNPLEVMERVIGGERYNFI